MSEKGGSDLDVFDNLKKQPAGEKPAKKTMLGMPAPNLPPIPGGSSRGLSAPPPPPPPTRSTGPRASKPPPLPGSAGSNPPPLPGSIPPPLPSSKPRSSATPPIPSGRGTPAPPIPPKSARGAAPPIPPKGSVPPKGPLASSAGPPPAAAANAPAGAGDANKGDVEMDWDDEDEKTTVYDRATEDAARALLRSSPQPAAGAPPPPMSRPPSAVPSPPVSPSLTDTQQGRRAPIISPAGPGALPAPAPNRTPLYALAAAVVLLGLVLAYLLRPQPGSLVVTVAGPGNKPLDSVEVLVDGEVKCQSSPCQLKNLDPKTYMVRARAAGHQETADTAVAVSGGQESVHNISLSRAAGTGVKVSGEGSGLKLFIDGKEYGPLPQEVLDLPAGEHKIKVAGNPRFEAYEQTVTVQPDTVETIGPLKLPVVKGLATIKAGTNTKGARIVLDSSGDRRLLPKLPLDVEIPTSKKHVLIATRRGYNTFRQELVFEDGVAEKTFEINMVKQGDEEDEKKTPPRTGRRTPPRTPPGARQAPTGGKATLNINSIPRANVILDGRPLGSTPKIGYKVDPGSHTLIFINGSQRKTKSVTVKPGGSATVAVRF